MVPEKSGLEDVVAHGTMVAGVIASNGKIRGVAPNVAITPYKVFDGFECDSTWVIDAIIEAANDKMDVVNISLGSYKSLIKEEETAVYESYLRAIDYARSNGCILVASAGTENNGYDISDPEKLAEQRGEIGDKQVHIPGGLEDVITVSAANRDEKLPFYSNYGYNIDFAAPSGDYGPAWEIEGYIDLSYLLLTTYPTNLEQTELSIYFGFDKGYEFNAGGTSLAAPKVTATVALIIAKYKEKYGVKPTEQTVIQLLKEGATNIDNKLQFGNGIINAKNSLNKLIEQTNVTEQANTYEPINIFVPYNTIEVDDPFVYVDEIAVVDPSVNLNKIEETNKSDVYILVVREGKDGRNIANTLKKEFPDTNFLYKKEINVITFKYKDVDTLNDIKNYINENLKTTIKRMGKSSRLLLKQ